MPGALTIGFLASAGMLGLIALGVPVAIALIAGAGLGILAIQGDMAALFQVGAAPLASSEYGLSVIPLFVLMGAAAARSGLVATLYSAANAVSRRFPGRLAVATIFGCGSFSAICGSSMATSATIGGIAIEQMQRFGYSPRLAAGSVAAGGTIGILIPPSILLVVYGILTEQSIAALFAAGLIPGLMLVALLAITVLAIVGIWPSAAPSAPHEGETSRLGLMLRSLPIVAIFLIVMVGIYRGFFTPTEAAAVGAFGTLVFAFACYGMTPADFRACLLETVMTSAMIFLIVVGSNLYSSFLVVTGLNGEISGLVARLQETPYLVIVAMLLIYVVLGCFMESFGMILLTVPVFYPVVLQLGFDPVWFGIMVVVVAEMGLITPPLGLNLFIVKSVAPHVPLKDITLGALAFLPAFAVLLAALLLAPELATWLPERLAQ